MIIYDNKWKELVIEYMSYLYVCLRDFECWYFVIFICFILFGNIVLFFVNIRFLLVILSKDFGFLIVYWRFILLFISIEKLYFGFIWSFNLGIIKYKILVYFKLYLSVLLLFLVRNLIYLFKYRVKLFE